MEISTNRAKLRKRLSGYWRMEIGNAAIIPAVIVFVAYASQSILGWLTWFTFVPMCSLLLLGGLYWRGKLLALEGQTNPLKSALATADRYQLALWIVSVAALVLALLSWLMPALSVSRGDRIAATICSVLAMLEYINYYHRQLQHFDHAADFKRLMTGKGFRKSQMAVDLSRYKACKRGMS